MEVPGRVAEGQEELRGCEEEALVDGGFWVACGTSPQPGRGRGVEEMLPNWLPQDGLTGCLQSSHCPYSVAPSARVAGSSEVS